MKTLHTTRVEALERRRGDLANLHSLRAAAYDAIHGAGSASLTYEPWMIVAGNNPNWVSGINANTRVVVGTDKDQNDLDTWFSRKISHATRDIENLETKLGGYHG